MGEINNALCNYFSVGEFYADFWNGTIFEGEQELLSENFHKYDKEYYKVAKQGKATHGKRTSSINRDVLMGYKVDIEFYLGLEIMETIDYTIPVRIMDYDVQEMKRQLQSLISKNCELSKDIVGFWKHSGEFLYGVRKEDRILPIITVALYCGTEEYDGAEDIFNIVAAKGLNIKLQKLLNNYPVRIYNLKKLREENYQTGFRELIAVFKRSKDKTAMLEYYMQHKERFRKLDALTIDTMGILIGKKTLKLFTQEGEGLDMCKAFEDAREEGKEIGKEIGAFMVLCDLVRDGLIGLAEAAKRINVTEETFERRMQEVAE